MSITLKGEKSDVVILATRLGQAIKEETGIVLKLSDDDFGDRLEAVMPLVEKPSTLALYDALATKKQFKNTSKKSTSSTLEIIKSNLHHKKLLALFNRSTN